MGVNLENGAEVVNTVVENMSPTLRASIPQATATNIQDDRKADFCSGVIG